MVVLAKMRKNGYRHSGGWKPKNFEDRKIGVQISGIPRKYFDEFTALADELKEMFLIVKEKEKA